MRIHPLPIAISVALIASTCTPLAQGAEPADEKTSAKREDFSVAGHRAFVIMPATDSITKPVSWVWYAPTLRGLPGKAEKWMFDQFHAAGVAVAGIDVGESYGSPKGRAAYQALYDELTMKRGFGKKPVLLARSRGGLMLYNWAAEHPELVGGIAGIYPVCNLESYPGLAKAAPAYEMTTEQLKEKLSEHNPIDRLEGLAKAKVEILHLHGDMDTVVPLEANSAQLAKRYKALGGPVEIEIIKGQGHNMWSGWFESHKLTQFAITRARGVPADAAEKTVKEGQKVTVKGKLTGGWANIGGESTGWQLAVRLGKAENYMEVDMSAITNADSLDGAQVTITGTMHATEYVERGKTWILKAMTVKRE